VIFTVMNLLDVKERRVAPEKRIRFDAIPIHDPKTSNMDFAAAITVSVSWSGNKGTAYLSPGLTELLVLN
jgi:hypothetical protein